MSSENIEAIIERSLHTPLSLQRRGLNDFRINVPFSFSDGDNLKIILRPMENGKFMLTDEAHTLMHLGYRNIEIAKKSARYEILEKILMSHDMEQEEGRLVMKDIASEDTGYAVFMFAQALLKVGDLAMLKSE